MKKSCIPLHLSLALTVLAWSVQAPAIARVFQPPQESKTAQESQGSRKSQSNSDPQDQSRLIQEQFETSTVPFISKYCAECHGTELAEAEIDLTKFTSISSARSELNVWQHVYELIRTGQMPPKDARQPMDAERQAMMSFLDRFLTQEARRLDGDPGPIVLRRLSNAEYTNTVRAITGIPTLDPAKEFPVDSASGEGFTNAGGALMMSPSLLTKYLDAGKEIASHAVLLPDRIRFSASTSRRDWTEESLADIRKLYAKYSASEGGSEVNLQGIVFSTNDGGRLPIGSYLRATIEERDAVRSGAKSIELVASQRHLSAKYLQLLWTGLEKPDGQLLGQLSENWAHCTASELPQLMELIQNWQKSLFKFNSVGHIGKVNGPKSWMESIDPIATRQEFRVPLPVPVPGADDVELFLVVGDASDGGQGDEAIWERPRLVAAGRPELLLKDLSRISHELREANVLHLQSAVQALAAADALTKNPDLTLAQLSGQFRCDLQVLEGWLEYLGIKSGQQFKIQGHLANSVASLSGYDFVKGWTGSDALSIIANSSDTHVRVPGNMFPHSVAVHPSPSVQMVVGWASPIRGQVKVSGFIRHAHPECGNGVVWALQLRRGSTVQTLASGATQGDQLKPIEVAQAVSIGSTDVLCLVVGPRDGNHSCDLTNIQMVVDEVALASSRKWDLTADVSNDILAGNPHSDSLGNKGVWHFFGEPVSGPAGPVIPAGSLLARWQASADASERSTIAKELADLLTLTNAEQLSQRPAADQQLLRQLKSLGGPLMAGALKRLTSQPTSASYSPDIGKLPAAVFGKRVDGSNGDSESLYVQAPTVIPLRLPASLVEGAELVTAGRLANSKGEGSVQFSVTHQPPQSTGLVASPIREDANAGAWTSSGTTASSLQPVVVSSEGSARARFEQSFHQFRQLFPAALCYNKIVPVDEVVTLTLYYREDEALRRLMLSQTEIQQLDSSWEELHFVSRDALALVDAFEQLWQYATQDADPSAFEPMRGPIMNRAAEFKKLQLDSQASHLQSVMDLANRAWRRPLTISERTELEKLYATLKNAELPHELAIQSLIARILVSPEFLYRLESGTGAVLALADGETRYRALNQHELATRLSYFLTSTTPDETLRRAADDGQLSDRAELNSQVARLIPIGARKLATEFGCQWLHIYDFAAHDEKSEQAFPTFNGLRESMYEESIRFWADLFSNNRSVLDLLESDHLFVNQSLAEHYGVNWQEASAKPSGNQIMDADWIRVANARDYGRGGILSMASVLSKQAGASRTSPILRGNWLSEVVLGEKLPKPPQGVPPLPETPPEGLNERQLIEKHSSDPACAKCHVKIDPFGFALEGYDAIGRRRDLAKHDTRTTLEDGTPLAGYDELRKYLVQARRDDFLRQFCKKLLGYSLGRAVQLSDKPLLDQMLDALKANEFKVQAALHIIVHSRQFQSLRVTEI